MPLDRSWYNSLVDDDGSNTVGTVWGKDDVNALMNAIDAELPTRRAVWTPEWRTSENGVCPTGPQVCRWYKVGDAIHFTINTPGLYVVNATFALSFDLPPGFPAIASYDVENAVRIGGLTPARLSTWRPAANPARAEILLVDISQYPAGGSLTFIGQGFYWWR